MAVFSLMFVSQSFSTHTAKAAAAPQPIFFVPGAYSSVDSWDPMFERLDPTHQHPVVKMYVASDGAITRTNVRAGNPTQRPFVSVYFENYLWNDQAAYAGADGLHLAIQSYQSTYPFEHADIVGQSNGGNIITRYLEAYPSNIFNNLITVGTPYNMRANDGDPATDWLIDLFAGKSRLNPNLNVINVIGDVTGNNTGDEVVSRDSSLAGDFVFRDQVASFKVLYMTGNDAIHDQQVGSEQFAQILENNLSLYIFSDNISTN